MNVRESPVFNVVSNSIHQHEVPTPHAPFHPGNIGSGPLKGEGQKNERGLSPSCLPGCFPSIAFFNPHISPPDLKFPSPFADEETAAQSADATCLKPEQVKGTGFSTSSCWRRSHSCTAWHWARSGLSAPTHDLYKGPASPPFSVSSSPFPDSKPFLVSSRPIGTPLLLSQWGTLPPTPGRKCLQGDFTSAPLQPTNVSEETPPVLCEMRLSIK